jgi:hypothetical protein
LRLWAELAVGAVKIIASRRQVKALGQRVVIIFTDSNAKAKKRADRFTKDVQTSCRRKMDLC